MKFNPITGKLETSSTSAGGSSAWGGITGTLADQTDLQTALNLKANLDSPTFTGTVVLPASQAVNGVTLISGGVATEYLSRAGTYNTPAGSGDMVLANAQTNTGVKTFLDATLGLRNVANSITSFFTNAATVARTWTFPNKDGTVAMTSDITGTNSGTNTGDNATNSQYSGLVSNANHTGDATGATALTLATVNANVGAFGSATQVAVPTVNAKGLVTAISNTTIAIPSTAITDFVSAVASTASVTANTAKNSYPAGDSTKVGHITVTQAVNLDTMESDIATNTAKVTNATHTGEVTGSGALTIASNAVTNAKAAQMATKTYKGRTSALTGDAEDVAVATLKTDLVLVKADVGLGSVDNTTDAGKPVSTAQQTALNLKADDNAVVKLTGAQTVAGAKTFSTPIATASVATMSATVGGGVPTPPNNTTTFLRGDGTFATPAGSGTVTNVSSANADATVATQTTTPVITVVQTPALRSATTTVDVSGATAPTVGQALIATSSTAATWQTVAGGGDVTLDGVQTLTNKTVTDPILPETISPTAPPSASVKLFGRSKGGRMMAAQIGPSGLDTALQPFMGSNKVSMWSHSGNSTAITAPTLFLFNMAHVAGNQEGTATTRTVTGASNILNGVRRLGLVTAAAINLSVGIRQTIAQYFRGNSTTKGGFFMTTRFGYNTAASGNRGFVGFSTTTGVFTITADPSATGASSTAVCIGFGFDAEDTNWQVFRRTLNSDAITKTDTGMAKPVAGKFYEVAIFLAPEATSFSLAIQDINTGTIYNLSTSTAVPPVNTQMSPRVWGNTGTSATALGIDKSLMYIETDY